MLLLEELGAAPAAPPQAEIYLVAVGERAELAGLALGEQLRDQLPGRRLVVHIGGGSFKSQMKKADRSGAELALILGEQELESDSVGFKPLRGGDQRSVPTAGLVDAINTFLSNEET